MRANVREIKRRGLAIENEPTGSRGRIQRRAGQFSVYQLQIARNLRVTKRFRDGHLTTQDSIAKKIV